MSVGAVGPPFTSGSRLRNVTAVSTAAGGASFGIGVSAGGTATVTLDARNVIARGQTTDVVATDDADPTGTATVTMASSNYASESEPGDAAVTDPGSGGNQVAPPLLADAGTGDFHQLSGSPTINAGTPDVLLGALDLDGEARTQGPAVDIGADEFVQVSTPVVPTPSVPIKKKKCKKKKKKRPAAAAKKRCKKKKKRK
jgi:hypothetical protein